MKSGTIRYFWRGARSKNLRWWPSLAEKPRKPVAPVVRLSEVGLVFIVGAVVAAILWVVLH